MEIRINTNKFDKEMKTIRVKNDGVLLEESLWDSKECLALADSLISAAQDLAAIPGFAYDYTEFHKLLASYLNEEDLEEIRKYV